LRHDGVIRELATDELEAGLDDVRQAPRDQGRVELLVRRPAVDVRETRDELLLDLVEGVVGDTWRVRGDSRTADGSANPEVQVTVMNARVARLMSDGNDDRWKLAGDQIYADFDLSQENLPAGSRLQIGSAVLEISAHPHTGCAKFESRFGADAMRFVNSPTGRALRLRGVNCKVVIAGIVRVGDTITKEPIVTNEPMSE
jgi:hypothetical protein